MTGCRIAMEKTEPVDRQPPVRGPQSNGQVIPWVRIPGAGIMARSSPHLIVDSCPRSSSG